MIKFALDNIKMGTGRIIHQEGATRTRITCEIKCEKSERSSYFELVSTTTVVDSSITGSRRVRLYPVDLGNILPIFSNLMRWFSRDVDRIPLISSLPTSLYSYVASQLTAISLLESRWDVNAINSKSGARGLFQMLPSTVARMVGSGRQLPSSFLDQCFIACELIRTVVNKLDKLSLHSSGWRSLVDTTYRLQSAIHSRMGRRDWLSLRSHPSLCFIPAFWSGGYNLTAGSLCYASLVYFIQCLIASCSGD